MRVGKLRLISWSLVALAFFSPTLVQAQNLAPKDLAPAEPRLPTMRIESLSKPSPMATSTKAAQSRVVIVFDDLGDSWEKISFLLGLDAPVTLSFLPETKFAKRGMEEAFIYGKDILLHTPMEPEDPHEMREGYFLKDTMTEEEIHAFLERQLYRCPNCVGMNNHMGSRFTKNPMAMARVMTFLRRKNLLFLDSRTTEETVGFQIARKYQVPSQERDVFLDHDPREASIRRQFRSLRRVAQEKGQAIAIGHPHRTTLSIVKEEIGKLQRVGIEVVPISELMSKEPR